MQRTEFSQVSSEELRHAYWDEGLALPALSRRYGRPVGTINDWFKKLGIPTRSSLVSRMARSDIISSVEEQEIVRLYGEGLSSNDIGAKLGRDGRLVRTHLKMKGVSLRSKEEAVNLCIARGKKRKHALNHAYFDTMTPDRAWVLGLIFGDGHFMWREDISHYGVAFCGTKEVCEKVATLIGYDLAPRKIPDLDCWVLVWNSKPFAQRMFKFGLEGGYGGKAKTMRFPVLPETEWPKECWSHFARGLMDSDGSWEVRNRSLRASYATASVQFAHDLAAFAGRLGIDTKISDRDTILDGKRFHIWNLRFNSDPALKWVEYVYRDSFEGIRCSRKYKKVSYKDTK